ncbi:MULTISPECIES: CoA-transferase subunit beta [unclassified Arthrobacter]|uniref:CoA-transferase subunit beta n=1 Tax=unclassified Arthrobacter TaxID=235627 RepID=UPI002DF9D936|nr:MULTISPECIES: CoA-transferase [unclassified Arthrobacter]MEC5193251.1 glutaconate CoA-transferase subunit B [Arthrobacter sp. MP_M4]MEC5204717.1 glutaconate CoA-transferase subunit B [Arthrobacter sp. MP_M7]
MTSIVATTTTGPDSTRCYTVSELLAAVSCRYLRGKRRVFAGIGLPTLAVALAQKSTSPEIEQIYESGVCGAHPPKLPETIADASLATGAEAIMTMPVLFGYVLQGGWIDVGFLGAAQIDKFGSLNTSVIGPWDSPTVRLPGSGGAAEVMANSQEVFVVMRRHNRTSFVRELDFCTSPSPAIARRIDPKVPTRGAGVTTVISELGVFKSDAAGELCLASIHEGVTVEQVREQTGWPVKVLDDLTVTPPPTVEELRLLRDDIDPGRVYLR